MGMLVWTLFLDFGVHDSGQFWSSFIKISSKISRANVSLHETL